MKITNIEIHCIFESQFAVVLFEDLEGEICVVDDPGLAESDSTVVWKFQNFILTRNLMSQKYEKLLFDEMTEW